MCEYIYIYIYIYTSRQFPYSFHQLSQAVLRQHGNHKETKDGNHKETFPATTETIRKPRMETIGRRWMMPQLETIRKTSW